ncbi:MAG: hemolysin family protein [Pseudomonadota bacterium]
MQNDSRGSDTSGAAQPEEPPSRWSFGRIFGRSTATEPQAEETTQNVQALSRIRVEDVAVPRADIIAISDAAPISAILRAFRDSGFSRLPVYNDALDNPMGLLHLKDLALKFGFNGTKATKPEVAKLVRPIIFVPPSMPVSVLLQRMQSERTHMALVIDEYGGVDGLLTIEDLVELVVGEITDEHDVEEMEGWTLRSDGSYLVQARAPLEDFEQVLGVDFADDTTDEDIDTLGGLVFVMLGRVPSRGEVVSHPKGFDFEIADADARKIKRVIVRPSKAKKVAAE